MSEQFSRAKRRKILNKMSDTIDKWDNANAKITEAVERAEKAEKEIERLREIITECDGIECVKHDALVRTAVKEQARLRKALAFYGNPENWRFTHDKDGNLLWITSIGPNYALEILGEKREVATNDQ
jgi:tRNA(Ile)-lysidine synthase TilS/MesJ